MKTEVRILDCTGGKPSVEVPKGIDADGTGGACVVGVSTNLV